MAKRKTKAKSAKKPTNPPIPTGANRRAVADLTRGLASKLEKIKEQKALLAKQENNLFDQFKKDTGRSKRATKRALAFYFMEDSTARATEISDQIETMRDLSLTRDLPLFAEVAGEAALAADREREQSTPGYIESVGRAAFADGKKLGDHGYPDDAKDAIEKWQLGFTAAAADRDEEIARKAEERAHARAAKVAERAAAKAARNGEAGAD